MPIRSRTVFIFSKEPWGDMWYSKHHYATQLAKAHTVYFVALPERWRWTDLFSFGVKVRTVKEGVKVVSYRNNLPLRYMPRSVTNLMAWLNGRKLRRLQPHGEVVHWCFHPIEVAQARALRSPGTSLIYHVVDPFQRFPQDRPLAREADLVVAINPWFEEYYSAINPHCILIPHGVRREDRVSDAAGAQRFRTTHGRYAVLATGLGNSVNYALLSQVAERFRDLRIVIAGQMFPLEEAHRAARERLLARPNVRYVGVMHPNELRDLVRGAAIGLLTYDFEKRNDTPIGPGRTPLKVLTYLAQSCPVVSTNNSYVPALNDRGFFKADDDDEFIALMDDVLQGRRMVEADAVEKYLDTVEYGALIKRILMAVDDLGRPAAAARRAVDQPDTRPAVPKDSPVLIVSNEGWDGPRYSKHRYAIALSRRRDVYFIDPAAQWRPIHFLRTRVRSRRTPEGITVLSYNNAIPLFGGALRGVNDIIITFRLRRHLRNNGRSRPLFWTFDPGRLASPGGLDPCIAVYHCADDHALRWSGERLLAERCDHVFCIARDLMPRFRMLNGSVHHVPHGLADEDMSTAPPPPGSLPAPPGYGLYIGNINDRHDFALWERLFAVAPGVTWLVVGPVNVNDPIGRELVNHSPPNVRFLGVWPYPELRRLITGAGFGFLYMRKDQPANRISSQKVMQFLAQGKPFFCSWFSEYANDQSLVHMTDDPDAALAAFTRWMAEGEPAEVAERRLDFAREHHFDNLLEHLPFRW